MSIADIPSRKLTQSEIARGAVPLGDSVIEPQVGVLSNEDLLALQERNRRQNQNAVNAPELNLTGTYIPGSQSEIDLLNETGDFGDSDTPLPGSIKSFQPLNLQVNPLNVTISDLSAFILDEQAGNRRGAFLLKMATGITVSAEEKQKFAKELLGELASDVDPASLSDSSFVNSFITQTLLVYHRLISQDLDNIINQGTSYGWFTDNGDLTTEGREKLELAIRSGYSTIIALTGEQAEKDKVVDFFIDIALTAKKAKIEEKAQRIIDNALHYLFEASPRGELLKLRLRQDVPLTTFDSNQLREALRPLLFIELDEEESSFALDTVRGAMGEVIDNDFYWERFIPQLQEKLEISSTPYERKFSLFEKLSTRLGFPTVAAGLGIAANLFAPSGNTVEQKLPSKPNKPTSAAVSTDNGRKEGITGVHKASEKVNPEADKKPNEATGKTGSEAPPKTKQQDASQQAVEQQAKLPTVKDLVQPYMPNLYEYKEYLGYTIDTNLVEFLKQNKTLQLSVLKGMYQGDIKSTTPKGNFLRLMQNYGDAVAEQLKVPAENVQIVFVNYINNANSTNPKTSSEIQNKYGLMDVLPADNGAVIAVALGPSNLIPYSQGQVSPLFPGYIASALERILSKENQEPATVSLEMRYFDINLNGTLKTNPDGSHIPITRIDNAETTKSALGLAQQIFSRSGHQVTANKVDLTATKN